jgi:hypothetical protein
MSTNASILIKIFWIKDDYSILISSLAFSKLLWLNLISNTRKQFLLKACFLGSRIELLHERKFRVLLRDKAFIISQIISVRNLVKELDILYISRIVGERKLRHLEYKY